MGGEGVSMYDACLRKWPVVPVSAMAVEGKVGVLAENAVCHTFKGSLFVALRMLLQLTYCSFNNQCEY